MAARPPLARLVEHGEGGRGADEAGLLVGEPARRIVGRDAGIAQSVHQAAGCHTSEVRGREIAASSPHDHIDESEVRIDRVQPGAVQEAARLD